MKERIFFDTEQQNRYKELEKELEYYKKIVESHLQSLMNKQNFEREERKKIEQLREIERKNRQIGQERRRIREEMEKIDNKLIGGWNEFVKKK